MPTQVSPPSSRAVVTIDDGLVERYKAQGWTVAGAPEKPFSQLNKSELEKVASDEGVDIKGAKTNDDIRAAIKAARN